MVGQLHLLRKGRFLIDTSFVVRSLLGYGKEVFDPPDDAIIIIGGPAQRTGGRGSVRTAGSISAPT